MSSDADLLSHIRGSINLSAFFAAGPGFDVHRGEEDDDPHLASGDRLAVIAGDFTGGGFYLCGEDPTSRPVLYASSEGDAGVIAPSLLDAIELMIGLPYWRDCLTYSDSGDLEAMQTAAALLQQDLDESSPETDAEQSRAAEQVGVTRHSVTALVTRLHTAVSSAGPDYTFTDATGEYGPLFGPFPPSRNQRWQTRLE